MNSPIAAGQTKSQGRADLVDAINQVFAIFRVNYHNQYYKAFPETDTLNVTKKLWLESLKDLPAQVVLQAGEKLVRSQDYLPTLSQMLRACRDFSGGEALPDIHSAFLEACNAPSPKSSHAWSHTVVYHAGRRTGWHYLATQNERYSFPVFQRHFENLAQEYLSGKELTVPALEDGKEPAAHQPASTEDARKHLQQLRNQLKS